MKWVVLLSHGRLKGSLKSSLYLQDFFLKIYIISLINAGGALKNLQST